MYSAVAVLMFLLSVSMAFAQDDGDRLYRPAQLFHMPVTVLVVDHLDLPTLAGTKLTGLSELYGEGRVALISPGLARFPDPEANQWATFTAGDVINTQNPHIGLLQRQLLANGLSGDVKIVRFGDCGTTAHLIALDRLVQQFLAAPDSPSILILCSIAPPQLVNGSWDELTPMVIYPAWPRWGPTLTSPTTRTRGLIALRDLAPTILKLAGAPIPPSMTGAPVATDNFGPYDQPPHCSVRDLNLTRMATITQLGQRVIVPLSWFLGLSAFFAIAGGAWIVAGGRLFNSPLVCYLLRLVLAAPLALLLAPCLSVSSVGGYLAALIGIDLALALIASPALLLALTVGTVLIDGVTGAHLMAVTVVSGYWLSGIRFYGIGNEYMGVLIGMSLLTPVVLFPERPTGAKNVRRGLLTALFFAFVVFVLSYPAFGAKAGGAVTSVVTFSLAWGAMFLHRKPTWIGFVVTSAFGFALIFALVHLAERLHAPPSHIQAAVSAVHEGRLGYIKHVAVRKAKMAVKTVLTPGGIVAVLGIVPLLFYWRRSRFGDIVGEFLSTRLELQAVLAAGGWGLLATILFNDSGGVAFLFFWGALALVVLHEMVRSGCVSSHSTSAMSV